MRSKIGLGFWACTRRLTVTLALPFIIAVLAVSSSSASDGISLSVGPGPLPGVSLQWSGGGPNNYVFRDTQPKRVVTLANKLGETVGTSWSDTPPAGQVFFYTVTNASLDVVTTVSADNGATYADTATAAPGTSVIVKVVATNHASSVTDTAVAFTDQLDPILSYVGGSGRSATLTTTTYAGATKLVEGSGGYSYTSATTTVGYSGGTIAPGQVLVLFFRAVVYPGTTVSNTATLSYTENGGGALPTLSASAVLAILPCTNLSCQMTVCGTPGKTTTVTGSVLAPNGVDPVVGAHVYVPNAAVQPFSPGVACGASVSGSPLVYTTTGVDGKFTLQDVPAGPNIPLVVQIGRWRRQTVVAAVTSCSNTAVPTTATRLPRNKSEGDIPLMAFVTGGQSALECILRKIGIADSEFTDPSGTGRVRFYKNDGSAGAEITPTTPTEPSLWGTAAALNQYDAVLYGCAGAQYARTATAQQTLYNYASAGGRVILEHYAYVWLYNYAPWSSTATWNVQQAAPTPDPQTGYVNQSFADGATLASWLLNTGASITLGQVSLATLRHDFDNVVAPSKLWLSLGGTPIPPGTVPMLYTFDTPIGVQPTNQCGRVMYSDFHPENATTTGTTFPAECNANPMTPQEKLMEFMLFEATDDLIDPFN